MTVLLIIETLILAVLTVLVAGLLRGYASVLARLHRLEGGNAGAQEFPLRPVQPAAAEFGPAHDVEGQTLTGEIVHARVIGVQHDTVLLFLSSGCASCAEFWDDLRDPVPLPPATRLLVVPQSPNDESIAALRAVAPDGVDVVLSSQAWRDYEVPGAPHVVLVNGASGRIRGEGTGQSLRQVVELLARATGDARFLDPGPAPAKSARDLRDETEVDRALLAAGILPGDPRLYGGESQ